METRTERHRRRKTQPRKKVFRSAVLFIVAVMIFLMKMALFTSEESTDSTFIRPVVTSYEAEPESLPEPQPIVRQWQQEEVEAIAKTVYGEAMITGSDKEMAAVAWCILNRVDSPVYPDAIIEVVTAKNQFYGYDESNPIDPYIAELVVDVLNRWDAERNGEENVGRVLPAEYLFFWGDGWHNHFTTDFLSDDEWDWTLQNPYDT